MMDPVVFDSITVTMGSSPLVVMPNGTLMMHSPRELSELQRWVLKQRDVLDLNNPHGATGFSSEARERYHIHLRIDPETLE